MNLYLIGYRGTGKSTVARLVADSLDRPWRDADALLEERAGQTIRAIFAAEGEAGFREREAAILRELDREDGLVVATGGGVILREDNRAILGRGKAVWLTASAERLWDRLQADATTGERRPNLSGGGLEEIRELLAVRAPHYQACADLAVATDHRSPAEVAALVADWFRNTTQET
ncbi:MAG: shikimate kinase [Gemmataceae bacterium]